MSRYDVYKYRKSYVMVNKKGFRFKKKFFLNKIMIVENYKLL